MKRNISWWTLLLFVTVLWASPMEVKLELGENKFKQLEAYTLEDYHFEWKIVYLDIASFYTKESDGNTFSLPDNVLFCTRVKLGTTTTPLTRKTEIWLAKAILNKEYFWKGLMPPSAIYAFSILRFMEEGDNHFKAVSALKDINEMLGVLDTMAEWRLWFFATRLDIGSTQPYSYKKVATLHRIRFAGINPFSCVYHEYFNFYDDHGKLVKTKKLKEYSVKGCSVILL